MLRHHFSEIFSKQEVTSPYIFRDTATFQFYIFVPPPPPRGWRRMLQGTAHILWSTVSCMMVASYLQNLPLSGSELSLAVAVWYACALGRRRCWELLPPEADFNQGPTGGRGWAPSFLDLEWVLRGTFWLSVELGSIAQWSHLLGGGGGNALHGSHCLLLSNPLPLTWEHFLGLFPNKILPLYLHLSRPTKENVAHCTLRLTDFLWENSMFLLFKTSHC